MRRGGTWVERSRPWAMESLSASLARPASATARCASPLASSQSPWSPFTFPNTCDQAISHLRKRVEKKTRNFIADQSTTFVYAPVPQQKGYLEGWLTYALADKSCIESNKHVKAKKGN